jgi:hypothetical protein
LPPALGATSPPKSDETAEFPIPNLPPEPSSAIKPPSLPKSERVSITIDQLVAAMQGKLQTAAEKVIQSILAERLEEAVHAATEEIERVREAQLRKFDEAAAEQFEQRMRASREEILGHLESRLGEVQSKWEEQQSEYRAQSEQIAQRLETLAAETARNLGETQKFADRVSREIEPQTRGRLEESLGQATEQFETSADRISDRQLVRVMEATRMVTREAAAQLDARVAESRALMHSAASSTLEEFRRQAEVQVDLAVSETTERVRSALAALDAENRATCETRRRALVDEVSSATAQSTEQFRSGMKAFLYSCLVAAVGAVDEHAKSTLDSLVKDPAGSTAAIPNITPTSSDDEKPN